MSQSRFSIVLVGVSALLRRPLVSRLRPAEGERSPWVVFAARGCLPFRRLPLGGLTLPPSTSGLPLGELAFGLTASAFGMHRFGVATRRVGASARRVGSSAFRFGDCRSAGWPSGSRLPLFGTHRFGVAFGELVLPPSASEIAARRVGLRAHASGLPSASWPSGSRLPLFGMHRFGIALGGLAFGLTASAFRHAPLRRLQLGELAFGLTTSAFRHAPLRDCPRRVGLRAHGFCFSACADPHRLTAEARAGGTHRHDTCFTSKHLSQHVNLPHRSP